MKKYLLLFALVQAVCLGASESDSEVEQRRIMGLLRDAGVDEKQVDENLSVWISLAQEMEQDLETFLREQGILDDAASFDDELIALKSKFGDPSLGTENDAQIAAALQFGDQQDPDIENDEKIAAALQRQLSKPSGPVYERYLTLPEAFQNQKEVLGGILHQAAAQAQDQDVHAANNAFFVPKWQEQLKPLLEVMFDAKARSEMDLKFNDLSTALDEISTLKGIDTDLLTHFNLGMTKISKYWPSADNETGQKTCDLAAWAVFLSKHTGASLAPLYDGIAENTKTNGGCHPGVNGRFLRYITFTLLGNLHAGDHITLPKK